MRSPLALFLIVLGWPTALLLVIAAYQWYDDEYYVPDPLVVSRAQIQHPNDHPAAVEALSRFEALPRTEQDALLAEIRATIVPMATWFDDIDRQGFALLCLGERHNAQTRRFLAARIFRTLKLDALHLETTAEGLADIERRLAKGREYAPLLGADIAATLRAARAANPSLIVSAIEETDRQWQSRQRLGAGSRDGSLAANLEAAFLRGGRNLVLFGAFHCTEEADRFYVESRRRLVSETAEQAASLLIIGEHQDGPLEAFVYFLDALGAAPGDFVLVDTNAVPPRIRRWFDLLWNGVFGRYRQVLVFRVEAG